MLLEKSLALASLYFGLCQQFHYGYDIVVFRHFVRLLSCLPFSKTIIEDLPCYAETFSTKF